MAKRVIKLNQAPVIPNISEYVEEKSTKVAAYARVSTSHEEQHMSLLAQTDYYRKRIAENENWIFAGIYSDDGISGTSYRKRNAFNQMIQDCRDGKINMIFTKSISRFARNTVDTISIIRELKALGVGVMFEKENIWTLDSKGEFILTLMSSIAQEESRSISENVTWGRRKSMADGKYCVAFSRFLGYDRGPHGEFLLNEREAAIVKRVFNLFLQGLGVHVIANKLTIDGYQTPANAEKWNYHTVLSILQNEKYRGDALLQKKYTENFLTKKQILNKGELPQYYVIGGHSPIIFPDLFDHVQDEIKRRSGLTHVYSGYNGLSGKMVCGQCGEFYGTCKNHIVYTVWTCRERGRTGHTCKNIRLYDYALKYQLKKELCFEITKRNAVISTLIMLVEKNIDDEKRKCAAIRFLRSLMCVDPDVLEFGEEPAFIIRTIVVYSDNHLAIELVDGDKTTIYLRGYTPSLGWKIEKGKPRIRDVKCRPPYEFTCSQCGKAFVDYVNSHRKYCSQACYIQARFHSTL